MPTTIDILFFYLHLHNELLKVKYALNLETLIYFRTYFRISHNLIFQSLVVVDRDSETQLQVIENSNWIDQCSKDYLLQLQLCFQI